MIHTDCHLHSYFSSDSLASTKSMIEQGIKLGLSSMCLTEHLDYDYPENSEGLDFLLDFQSYQEELFALKETHQSKIEVLFGIELGLMKHLGDRYQKVLDTYPFDFAIGSSHLVNGIDPYEPEYFDTYGQYHGMLHYFESILENIHACKDLDYQVYGHLDYAIRYAPEKNKNFHFSDYEDLIDSILRELIRQDKGIEVNTAGLRIGLGQPNPHRDILKRYHELGGSILTIGSDAHKPEDMAFGFDQIGDFLRSIGFDHYTIFRGRKPFDIPIEK